MASAVIHLAIAKELEKEFNIKNKKDYYLGAIAPDISKLVNETKKKSHFIFNSYEDIPNLDIFKQKYPNFENNDFELGYYIHLFADKEWFEDFLGNKRYRDSVKLLDGTIINISEEEITKIIYQDYTNINITIIDNYNLDLELFYEEFEIPNTRIEEIPVNKLNILIDKMGIIIENSKKEKELVFDIYEVEQYITNTVNKLKKDIRKEI